MSNLFNCPYCSSVFLSQQALTEHIVSTNCAYHANLNTVASANQSSSVDEFETMSQVDNVADMQERNLSDVSMGAGFDAGESDDSDLTNNADSNGKLSMLTLRQNR